MPTTLEKTAIMENISIHPPQRLLFGPGPSQVHPRVYQALAQPIVGHLDAYFFEISANIQRMLRNVFGTKNELTFVISATGSGGMETAISNFVLPGMKVVSFANGFFCDRMSEMARRKGAELVRFEKPWGEVFGDDEAAEFIRTEKPKVVMYVQAETSAGAFQRGEAICKAAHEVGALVIADCVTSLGAMPVEVDKTGIDIAYSCTQKGLSCPPGLSPITVSPRAAEWLKARETANRSWYFDLKLIADYLTVSHRYHHTASATMFYGLHEGLTLIEEEGLERRQKRHHDAHLEFVKQVEALGSGDAGSSRASHLEPEHAQGAARRGRRQSPRDPAERARHRDRRRLRATGRQSLPHRRHGPAGDEGACGRFRGAIRRCSARSGVQEGLRARRG